MGKRRGYSVCDTQNLKFAKAKASNMIVHYKNTLETANVIRGMSVKRANAYLKNVIAKKECVPFRKFNGGVGRCAQAKNFKTTQGRWPKKSAVFLLELIQSAVSNAEYNGMECDALVIKHIQVNQAPTKHRRTYRAHGVINPYVGHPSHLQIVIVDDNENK